MLPTPAQQDGWTDPDTIRAWWGAAHQAKFHRPYSAELVASLRGPFVEFWPASQQAIKLRGIFDKHHEDHTATMAIGATDVISTHLMSDAGYETIYVSGSTCSVMDNPTQDFGADMADYPSNTVPEKVYQLFRSQLMQTKVSSVRQFRGEIAKSLSVDRMVPIIADADTGHGGQTANMKLAKMFVEAGAAAIHLDDQVPGTKKFGAKTAGRVLVPVEEHITRLLACKLQFDVMGVECLLIHRTDAETAGYLTSAISPVDRPYILGSTNPGLRPLVATISSSGASTKAEAEAQEDDWVAAANLMTLDEAVSTISPDRYEEFRSASRGQNVAEAMRTALMLGIEVYWDADASRSREGWYRFRGAIEPAIDRAIACARYADVLWTRTPATVESHIAEFAKEVKDKVPEAILAYNLAGDVQGSDTEIKAFTERLGKMGYVWQFLPLAGQSGTAVGISGPIKAIKEDGVLGYLNSVIRPGKSAGVSVLEYAWQGGPVADATVAAIALW